MEKQGLRRNRNWSFKQFYCKLVRQKKALRIHQKVARTAASAPNDDGGECGDKATVDECVLCRAKDMKTNPKKKKE